jgi:hypothetical protein
MLRIIYPMGGGKSTIERQENEAIRICPHPRTLRKAREQVKRMVSDGVSLRRIRSYLHRFAVWWSKTVSVWRYCEMLTWFMEACWDINLAAVAEGLLKRDIIEAGKNMALQARVQRLVVDLR